MKNKKYAIGQTKGRIATFSNEMTIGKREI